MSRNIASPPRTFLDTVAGALERASAYNKQDQDPPVAVLWPDKERQWEALTPRFRELLPIFALGSYAPGMRTGPAYWLRCIVAHTIPHVALAADQVPILYLPGYSRQDVRAGEDCPRELQPLAELQYRGVLWAQRNGRDWTISAFIQSEDGGLGIEVGADHATRDALERSLVKLVDEPIEALHRAAPLRALFLDGLLHPDEVKNILRWLDDPNAFRSGLNPEEWGAFVALCQSNYGFHPEKDGAISAARRLGRRQGGWDKVWRRFAEAPGIYGGVPTRLRQAHPGGLPLMVESPECWPQENEMGEDDLRQRLRNVASLNSQASRGAVQGLEAAHGGRRSWVWAALGEAPLAHALEHLAILAEETKQPLVGSSVTEVAAAYTDRGWRADLAVLEALATVETAEDLAAVKVAIRNTYQPWLDEAARTFQEAIARVNSTDPYVAASPLAVTDGTCILFSDGLRYDAAYRLRELVALRGLTGTLKWRLAALPTVTETAKPALSPAAFAFTGIGSSSFDPLLATSKAKVNVEVLRTELGTRGIEVLRGEELGNPSGRAWTEFGDIDAYGEEHGSQVAHRLADELRGLARRIESLVGHGWQRVIVVTDHGWLLLPGGLPKVELPEHLTAIRKRRCARLKDGANTDHQVVPWYWDPSVRIAVAPGIYCYEANREYAHGGISPQECVVPVLTVTAAAVTELPVTINTISWRGLRCDVMVDGGSAERWVDLRTKPGDPATSLIGGEKQLAGDGTLSFLVPDYEREGDAAVIVVLGPDKQIRKQAATQVGGDR